MYKCLKIFILSMTIFTVSDHLIANDEKPIRQLMNQFSSMTDIQRERWRHNNSFKHIVSGNCRVHEIRSTGWLSEIKPPESKFEVDCRINDLQHVAIYLPEEYEERVYSLSKGDRIDFTGNLVTMRHWGFWDTAYVQIKDRHSKRTQEPTDNYSYEQSITQQATNNIKKLIDVAKDEDIVALSHLIDFSYPIGVVDGVAAIRTREEFIERHDELFDAEILTFIANTEVSDWDNVGYRGITAGDGKIWLNEDGLVYIVNHETTKAISLQKNIINRLDEKYFDGINNYKSVEYIWETKNGIYRIDNMGQENYRLTHWKSIQNISKSPDLSISNGMLNIEGSGGFKTFSFTQAGEEIILSLGAGEIYYKNLDVSYKLLDRVY